jgi:hypothetical protein
MIMFVFEDVQHRGAWPCGIGGTALMMFDKTIDSGTLESMPGGWRDGVRLPWYRALPLSTVEVHALRIDGQAIAPSAITFVLDGRRWSLDELATETEAMWFTTDTALLEVAGDPIAPGSEHQVDAAIGIRPPYIRGLRRIGRAVTQMQAR